MKKLIIFSIFVLGLIFGCTDVTENVYDQYAADEFYSTPEGVNASLAGVYAQLPGNWGGLGYAGADRGWYDLNTMASDEQVVPHRTTGDWSTLFAQMYQRQWTPSHQFIGFTWNWLYESIYKANLAVDQLESAGAEESRIAEAKVLRAFFYYLLIDGWGDVPFYTENTVTVDEIPVESRSFIFNWIETELTDNIEALSEAVGGEYYGRFNKWAGYAFLAKLYLNAEVYTGTPMYEECLSAIQNMESGGFSLHSGAIGGHPVGSAYYELFGDQLPTDEVVFAIPMTVDIVGRAIFTVRSLGGTDGGLILGEGVSGWNGTVIPSHYLDWFDFNSNDVRNFQFRFGIDPYGPQPEGFIAYDTEVNNLDNPGAPPNAGARSQKFYPVPPMNGGGASNDFPVYRYADFLLMKAECLVRTGQTGAKQYVDQVRQRAGLDPLAGNPTLDDIYAERSRELTWEGHRRQDMIRFGTFTEAHGLLQPAAEEYRKLWPIPTSALNANPNLDQNPGY